MGRREEVYTKFAIQMHPDSMLATCKAKKHQDIIKRFREKYLSDVRAVPIAHKRVRLDDLEKVRKKVLQVMESNPLETASQREEYAVYVGRLKMIEDAAREEMERKPQLIAALGIEGYREYSDEDLSRRKDELIREAEVSLRRATSGTGEYPEGADSEDTPEPA